MKTSLPALGLAVLLGFASLAPARAALTISAADVVDGSYEYFLNYNKLYDASGSPTGIVEQDAWALTNTKVNRDMVSGSYRGYVQLAGIGSGTSFGAITYKFDFSDLGYAVSSMSVYDYLRLDAPGSGSTKIYTASTYYSFDGAEWVDIRSVNTTGGTGVDSAGKATTTIDFASMGLDELPTAIYYRVEFTSVGGTFSASAGAQWARSSNATEALAAEKSFSATFALATIPEASSMAWTVAVGGIGILPLLRRRPRNAGAR